MAGGYRVDMAQTASRPVVHRAPPAARRLVGLEHPLPENRLLVRADCGDTGAGAFRHAFAAGVSRNLLRLHTELPLPGVRKPAICFSQLAPGFILSRNPRLVRKSEQ